MPKQLLLSIPTPCHENWDAMTPLEKGKFCGSCQKQVMDFSRMSDREIAQFFKKPTTGSVCGRFTTDQLDRAIDIPKKRIPWLKYFFQVTFPALFISKASAQANVKLDSLPVTFDTSGHSKDKKRSIGNTSAILTGDTIIFDRPTCSRMPSIFVKVIDENDKPVANPVITTGLANYFVQGDKNGRAEVQIPT